MTKKKFSINNFEETVCALALFVTIVSITINIIIGAVTGRRYGQLEEISLVGFVWITFMGVGAVYKYNSHICIDFFVNALPKRLQDIVDIFVYVLLAVFNIYLISVAGELAISATEKTTPLLGISYFFIDLSVVVGFSCMTIRTVVNLVRKIKKFWNHEKEDHA